MIVGYLSSTGRALDEHAERFVDGLRRNSAVYGNGYRGVFETVGELDIAMKEGEDWLLFVDNPRLEYNPINYLKRLNHRSNLRCVLLNSGALFNGGSDPRQSYPQDYTRGFNFVASTKEEIETIFITQSTQSGQH